MNPVMNDTKWDELRRAMYGLGELSPAWRTQDVSGYLSPWDGEWYYHFREGGYASIEWVEIRVTSPAQHAAVLASLREVHVPGEVVDQVFRVYGYAAVGMAMNYI
jgi:hypothetical protein